MESKILVTGATGNIGKGVVELLKSKNANFVAGTTNGDPIVGVKTVKVDFADKDSLEKEMGTTPYTPGRGEEWKEE